ncbi:MULTISPECIES: hypothetical protein [Asticcacaulis]|uniref:hypothetical protein n=1 Tax=Asticcacaulis TaxID=76890 RepID=UPI001AE0E955|nr:MULTISPECIES: hypothetical protein [Asticcacaulis]MBP2158087.1 hypothetical protein [Asticcacaulis solisilvae]MDR6799132.1 hypothetical protein [Asticcacaulis sp. BE141]
MWPFKSKPLLDADTAHWHVSNFCWLLRNLARTPMFTDTRLILPAPGFFDTGGATGHAQAEAIFDRVRTYAGMGDWPAELVSDVETYERNTDLVQATSRHTPLGLFMADTDNMVRIAYAPRLLKTPANLIATLAHELAHYVVHSIHDTLPCGPAEEEFLTDQTACFLGFGVFMANNVLAFEQWRDDGTGTQGWSTSRSGYLPEADLVFNLALFLTAKDLPADDAMKYLKPHLAGHLKTALRDAETYKAELAEAIATAF